MSQALTDQTLSAANDAITATLGSANQPVGSVLFSIASGTYGTAVIKFQAQQKSGGSWVNIAAALVETPQTLVSGNISPTDNTAYTYRVSGVEGLYAVRMLLVSISSGSISASGSYVNVSEMATTIMPLPLSTARLSAVAWPTSVLLPVLTITPVARSATRRPSASTADWLRSVPLPSSVPCSERLSTRVSPPPSVSVAPEATVRPAVASSRPGPPSVSVPDCTSTLPAADRPDSRLLPVDTSCPAPRSASALPPASA